MMVLLVTHLLFFRSHNFRLHGLIPDPKVSWPRSNSPKISSIVSLSPKKIWPRWNKNEPILALSSSQILFLETFLLCHRGCDSKHHECLRYSGLEVEVFVSNTNGLRSSHVGMRSPADATALIKVSK